MLSRGGKKAFVPVGVLFCGCICFLHNCSTKPNAQTSCLCESVDVHISNIWKLSSYLCVRKSFRICATHQILSGWQNQGIWDGRGMWHAWKRRETRSHPSLLAEVRFQDHPPSSEKRKSANNWPSPLPTPAKQCCSVFSVLLYNNVFKCFVLCLNFF
jgi:hypothetical protein